MRSRVVVPLLLASCYAKPDPPIPLDAPSTPGCMPAAVMDDFTGATPCAAWATFFANSGTQTSSGGGALTIAPGTVAGADGGCLGINSVAFDAAGVFLEVETIVEATTGFTTVQLDGDTGDVAMNVSSGRLQVGGLGVTPEFHGEPYEASTMRWWRLRPDLASPPATIADISDNGSEWQPFFRVPGVMPSTVVVQIVVGVNASDPSPGQATFHNLGICP